MSDLTSLSYTVRQAVESAVNIGRQIEAGLRPETVEVLAPVAVGDGMGGTTETWTAIVTLEGRLQVSGREPQSVNIGGGLQVRQLWEWVFAVGTNISSTARLRANGITYAVISDDQPQSYSTAAVVLCYEVAG